MKKFIITMMMTGCLLQAGAQQKGEGKVIIRGTITGDTKGYNKIYMYGGHGGTTDSTEMKNGVFTFETPFTGPALKLFYLEYTIKKGMMYVPFGILIDKPAVLQMTGDADKGLDKSIVTGSETEELYQAYNAKERTASFRVYDSLKSLYGKNWMEDDDPQAAAFAKSRDSLQQLFLVPVIMHFVKAHPGSYTSAFILNAAAREALNAEQKQAVYNMLTAGNKKTEPAKAFLAFAEGVKNSAIGRQVKDFTLPEPDGKPFSFDHLKGKYVIIDFWASWCSPCRQSFPRMRKIYQKFKGDKFEMFSISIDQSREAWLKAVKEENNPWIQALDTKNISKSGFAITGVPTTYLVDPNGKIMMKQVGFDPDKEGPMEKKLDELIQAGAERPAAAQQQGGGKVIIKGTLTGDTKGYNKVYMYGGHDGSSDSAVIQNGTFTFDMPFTGPAFKMLYLEYTVKSGMGYTPFGLLIDKPAVFHLSGDINQGLDKSVVTGSRSEELFQLYRAQEDTADGRVYNSLNSLYGKTWVEDGDPRAAAFAKSRDSLNQLYLAPVVLRFVKAHPDAYTSAYVLNGGAREALTMEQKEAAYKLLTPGIRQTEPAKQFLAFTEGMTNSAIGREVKDFTLPDPDGKSFSFDQLKGKYVIVDFWASWCYPCRKSFPRMRKIYEKFKGNKFEMYSISIDENKTAWLKAVKEENNPWLQALDTKYVSKSGFAVSAVPTAYLIDPNGKIIMKQVGFDPDGEGPLEKKLDELLQ